MFLWQPRFKSCNEETWFLLPWPFPDALNAETISLPGEPLARLWNERYIKSVRFDDCCCSSQPLICAFGWCPVYCTDSAPFIQPIYFSPLGLVFCPRFHLLAWKWNILVSTQCHSSFLPLIQPDNNAAIVEPAFQDCCTHQVGDHRLVHIGLS